MTLDPDKRTRMSESKPDPLVGRTVGGYRIEELVGRGGMGTVYKATQLSLGRAVALKVLTQDLSEDAQFLERFHREADVLSRLSHPNIVTVIDRGEVDGRPFLVMEYVEGRSLRDIVRGGRLPPAEALRIVSSVLAALAHAHRNGIVHRDIKPENVLLAKGGIVKVADFGLSRILGPEEKTRLTRTHLVLGTYEYMAPEQREHSREADERSDLYATGVVLYEMLTGELPIGRFGLPSQRRPGECDSRFDHLIERSLEKDPDQRYQQAEQMADAVSAILERADAPPPPLPPRSAARTKTYRAVRFEYHMDNVATIDHVLGTVCYVLGFLALFNVLSRTWTGMPLILFFIFGWYFRETAENLRKFKVSARTSQAAIAILCGLTFVLLPFTIYSLWVLFGHRGRTYYEARGRGLDESEAARYTERLMEAPYGPPAPPRVPVAPTPSQIPVQSMVTSDVIQPLEPEPRVERRSGFVTAGLALFGLFIAAFVVVAVTDVELPVSSLLGLGMGVAVSFMLLLIGFFHALLTPRVRGALAAFFGMFLVFIAGGVAVLFAGSVDPDEIPDDYRSYVRKGRDAIHGPIYSVPLGRYVVEPPAKFEDDLLASGERLAWLRDVTGVRALDLELRREGAALRLDVPRSDYYDTPENTAKLALALQCMVSAAWEGFASEEISIRVPVGFDLRLVENPPPPPSR